MENRPQNAPFQNTPFPVSKSLMWLLFTVHRLFLNYRYSPKAHYSILLIMFDFLDTLLSTVTTWWTQIQKVVLRWWFQTGEIERICASYHNAQMSILFSKSLKASKQLSTYSSIIFYPKLFSVQAAYSNLCEVKKIPVHCTSIVTMNIKHCLHALRYVNVVIGQLEKSQKTVVDLKLTKHQALLDEFWQNMRPNNTRTKPEEWGDVGFQGLDPTTDFRGLGLLGLQQLVYFSKIHPEEARKVLLVSNHPRRYFPFAATGINISAFMLELVRSRRVHRPLLQSLETNTLLIRSSSSSSPVKSDRTQSNSSVKLDRAQSNDDFTDPASIVHSVNGSDEGPSDSEPLVALGVDSIHDIYCHTYLRYHHTHPHFITLI